MYLPYQITQALADDRQRMAERDRRTATLQRAHRETRKARRQDHRLVRVLFPRTAAERIAEECPEPRSGGTVKYMMLVCLDPTIEADREDDSAAGYDIDTWVREMDGRGVRLEGRPLPVSDATTVRMRHGDVLISDGPFAETKEQMVGYDLLECANLEEAIEVASKHPLARRGAMELRPFSEG